MKNQPRLHHYLPRFYLEGFADPVLRAQKGRSVIWVYEKGKPIRASTPTREAREHDFYALDVDGARDFQIEHWLGTIEQTVAPIIKRLENVRYVLSQEERKWMALFVGTMHTRTPSGRDLMDNRVGPAVVRLMKEAANDMHEFASLCHRLDPVPDSGVDLEQARKDILEGRVDAASEVPNFKLLGAIETGWIEAEIFQELDWQVVYSDGAELFLTSDHPVVAALWEPNQGIARFHMGVNILGVDIGFPLSRTMWLRMKRGIEPGPCRIPELGVRLINKTAMLNAHRRAYAAESSPKLKKLFDRRGCEASVETFRPSWDGKLI